MQAPKKRGRPPKLNSSDDLEPVDRSQPADLNKSKSRRTIDNSDICKAAKTANLEAPKRKYQRRLPVQIIEGSVRYKKRKPIDMSIEPERTKRAPIQMDEEMPSPRKSSSSRVTRRSTSMTSTTMAEVGKMVKRGRKKKSLTANPGIDNSNKTEVEKEVIEDIEFMTFERLEDMASFNKDKVKDKPETAEKLEECKNLDEVKKPDEQPKVQSNKEPGVKQTTLAPEKTSTKTSVENNQNQATKSKNQNGEVAVIPASVGKSQKPSLQKSPQKGKETLPKPTFDGSSQKVGKSTAATASTVVSSEAVQEDLETVQDRSASDVAVQSPMQSPVDPKEYKTFTRIQESKPRSKTSITGPSKPSILRKSTFMKATDSPIGSSKPSTTVVEDKITATLDDKNPESLDTSNEDCAPNFISGLFIREAIQSLLDGLPKTTHTSSTVKDSSTKTSKAEVVPVQKQSKSEDLKQKPSKDVLQKKATKEDQAVEPKPPKEDTVLQKKLRKEDLSLKQKPLTIEDALMGETPPEILSNNTSMEVEIPVEKIIDSGRKYKMGRPKKDGKAKKKEGRKKRSTRLEQLLKPQGIEKKRDRAVVKYRLLDSGKFSLEECKTDKSDSKITTGTKKPKPRVPKTPAVKIFKKGEGSSFKEKLKQLSAKRREENASKKKEAKPSKPSEPPSVLDKSQAEFAVSALFNYKSGEQSEGDANPTSDDNTLIVVDGDTPSSGEKKTRKRRKFKKIQKPTPRRTWSKARMDAYKNRKKRIADIRSRAERELERLGHVVINMKDAKDKVDRTEEEKRILEPVCEKEFCKMGCVCQSLTVPMREEFHCGKAECVMGCICSHAGASNCLFDSRVQDKTRNLAPGEKEFINTVIKGSENLVMAERGKRERKIPQRLQNDFFTGEEFDNAALGSKKSSRQDQHEELSAPAPKKRLLVENWDALHQKYVCQSSVPSPDFVEDRCAMKVHFHYDSTDEDMATKMHIDSIDSGGIQDAQKYKKLCKINSRTRKLRVSKNPMSVVAKSNEEEVTPKIISISSIAPEEFENADTVCTSAPAKNELEIINEVSISIDSPTSFGLVEARQKAKHRAMQLLPQFKESIIDAYKFKPTMMTYNKFCIVDWTSFTNRFYNHDLNIWVELDVTSKHKIAVITGGKAQPYPNFINVWVMGNVGLPQEKTFDNLNLHKGSPRCPFILWCNGHHWEILGKLSNATQNIQNRVRPEPISLDALPVDSIDSKWFVIPATMTNTYERLEVNSEKLMISYHAVCNMMNATWRTKQAFISKVKKLSGPHLHKAPLGLYSLPSKAKIFLGPFSKHESTQVKLVPFTGIKDAINAECVLVSRRDLQPLRPILPKVSTPTASTSSADVELSPQTIRDLEAIEDAEITEVGHWWCSRADVKDVPYVLYYNDTMQIKHPMGGNKCLLFETAKGVARFLEYIYQDMYDEDIEWTPHDFMSEKCMVEEYAYLKRNSGTRISNKELMRVLGIDDTGRRIRHKQTSVKLLDFQGKKSPLEMALARCKSYKEEMRMQTEKRPEVAAASGEIAVKPGEKTKVSLVTAKRTPFLRKKSLGLASVRSFTMASPDQDAQPYEDEIVDESPEVEMVEKDEESQDVESLKHQLEKHVEEDMEQYKKEVKEAFQIAESLYPSFGEGRHSRLFLLQRMNNEIELLQLQEKAYEVEKTAVLKEKSEIFKRFSKLPKKDRKEILLAIKELNSTKQLTTEAPPEERHKIEVRKATEPTCNEPEIEEIKIVEESKPEEKDKVIGLADDKKVETALTKAAPAPENDIEEVEVLPLPKPPAGPTKPTASSSSQAPKANMIVQTATSKIIVPSGAFVHKPGQIISLVPSNKAGEFIRLSNIMSQQKCVAVIRPAMAGKPSFIQTAGTIRPAAPGINSTLVHLNPIIPTIKKPADGPNPSIKASAPWVKCISSAVRTSDDKIKIIMEKNTSTTSGPTRVTSENLSGPTRVTVENLGAEEDPLDGMPHLVPCSSKTVEPGGTMAKLQSEADPSSTQGKEGDAGPSSSATITALPQPKKRKSFSYSAASFEMALHTITEEGMPVARAAREFGIPSRTLYSYLNKARNLQEFGDVDEIDICSESGSESSVELLSETNLD